MGGVISALRALQKAMGHVPESADAIVADVFNLSRAEVKGIVSFYEDFKRSPKGKVVVKLCAAEACQSVEGEELISRMEKELGLSLGETAKDGSVTLEPVYCLGLCTVGPAAMINNRLVGRADAKQLTQDISKEINEEKRS